MIPKGGQRGGGQDHATHLLNEFTNDLVEVLDVRGTISTDLHGAYAEWRAMADGTQCTQYIYTVSINPWEDEYGRLSPDQYMDMIERLEAKLDLENQPRTIVKHVKDGREHYHVSWSRILADEMKAVQMSHDRQKRREVARQFCIDYGLPMPEGLEQDLGKDHFYKRKQYYDLYQKAAQDRTGMTKAEHMAIVTDIWDRSDSGQAFKAGLEEAGYALTRGDSTDYVIVDRDGEHFNASKLINYENVKLAEMCAFLEHANPDFKDQLEHAGSVIELRKAAAAAVESHMKEDFVKQAHALNKKLEKVQTDRRAAFDKKYNETQKRQKAEAAALAQNQKLSGAALRRARMGKQSAGLAAMLYRVTGIRAASRIVALHRTKKLRRTMTEERAALKNRHKAEHSEFDRQLRNMTLIEKKERKELDAKLRLLGREMAGSGKSSAGKTAEPRKLKNIDSGLFKPRDPGRGGKDK